MCYYLENGGIADALDQKTLIEYVLLGDPSIHPVAAKVSCPESTLDVQERAQRRAIHARRAREIRKLLPKRSPATSADRPGRKMCLTKPRAERPWERCDQGTREVRDQPGRGPSGKTRDAIWATRTGNRWNTIGLESALGMQQTQTCLMRAETDLEGNLYRAYVGYSS